MKTARKAKSQAKKQLDQIIDRLRENEYLQNPSIQSFIEKVHPSGEAEKATVAEANQPKVGRQLLDLIKTSDVANKIAETVLKKAGPIEEILERPIRVAVQKTKSARRSVEKKLKSVQKATKRVASKAAKKVSKKAKTSKVAAKAAPKKAKKKVVAAKKKVAKKLRK